MLAQRAVETQQLHMISVLAARGGRVRDTALRVFSEALRPGMQVRCTGMPSGVGASKHLWLPPSDIDQDKENGAPQGVISDYWVCWVAPCWPEQRGGRVINWRVWLADIKFGRVLAVKTKALLPKQDERLQIVSILKIPVKAAGSLESHPAPALVSFTDQILPLDSPVPPPGSAEWRAGAMSLWRVEHVDSAGGLHLTSAVSPTPYEGEGDFARALYLPAHFRHLCMGLRFRGIESAPGGGDWSLDHQQYVQVMWRIVMKAGWLCDGSTKLAIVTGCSLPTDPEVRKDIACWVADGWSQSVLKRDSDADGTIIKVGHAILYDIVASMPANALLACEPPEQSLKSDGSRTISMERTTCSDLLIEPDKFSTAVRLIEHLRQSNYAARWVLAAQGHPEASTVDIECHAPVVSATRPYLGAIRTASDYEHLPNETNANWAPSTIRYAVHAENREIGPYTIFMVDTYYRRWKVCKLRLLTRLEDLQSVDRVASSDSEAEFLESLLFMWHPAHQCELDQGVSTDISFAIPAPTSPSSPPYYWFPTFDLLKEWLMDAYSDILQQTDVGWTYGTGDDDADGTEEWSGEDDFAAN